MDSSCVCLTCAVGVISNPRACTLTSPTIARVIGPITSRIKKFFDAPSASGFNDSYRLQAFATCTPPSRPAFCVKDGVNGINGQVSSPGISTPTLLYQGKTASAAECETACAQSSKCTAFTWISPSFSQSVWHNMCYLRIGGTSQMTKLSGIVTGWRGACESTSCDHVVTSAKDCFSAATELPALANFSMTTHEVASDSTPPGCTVIAGEKSAKIFFNSNNVSKACCGVSATSTLSGTARTLQGSVGLQLSVRGAEGKVFITITGRFGA